MTAMNDKSDESRDPHLQTFDPVATCHQICSLVEPPRPECGPPGHMETLLKFSGPGWCLIGHIITIRFAGLRARQGVKDRLMNNEAVTNVDS